VGGRGGREPELAEESSDYFCNEVKVAMIHRRFSQILGYKLNNKVKKVYKRKDHSIFLAKYLNHV
jgi:hypothetical protein